MTLKTKLNIVPFNCPRQFEPVKVMLGTQYQEDWEGFLMWTEAFLYDCNGKLDCGITVDGVTDWSRCENEDCRNRAALDARAR